VDVLAAIVRLELTAVLLPSADGVATVGGEIAVASLGAVASIVAVTPTDGAALGALRKPLGWSNAPSAPPRPYVIIRIAG
jgi:hypothetical protein